jgi:hypothetical protein
VLFFFFLKSNLEGALWLCISKFILTLTSVQQYSLCSAASCFYKLVVLTNLWINLLHWKFPNSYLDKPKPF